MQSRKRNMSWPPRSEISWQSETWANSDRPPTLECVEKRHPASEARLFEKAGLLERHFGN